jgi:pimeloyl-ACP methyl ester carboxylesterase
MKTIKFLLASLFTCSILFTSLTTKAQVGKLKIDTIGHSDRNLFDENDGSGRSQRMFPYPIIFVHGLAGDWYSWGVLGDMLYNASFPYGGQLEYCLNSDVSNFSANQSSDILTFVPQNLPAADFYDINFDCNPNGNCFSGSTQNTVLSNQAAIVKQGIALGHAINAVLQATGRNKVILMGHSMGGLCIREYLQNPNLWPDTQHHVAKIITSGTPHGGSNATTVGLTSLIDGVEEQSEAMRDLRESYVASGYYAPYLFGGIEDDLYVQNSLFWSYYNVDVNCNGSEGNNVVGLNQKDLYTDLDIAIIRSDYNWLLNGGDGVVDDENADLTNYYSGIPDYEKFWCSDHNNNSHSDYSHTAMPEDLWVDMKGLDEPDDYHLSYEIEIGESYKGFITIQGQNANYTDDFDDYILDVGEPGWISIGVTNLENGWSVSIYDLANANYLQTQTSNGTSNTLIQNQQISAGQYIVEIYGTPYFESWLQPYSFTTSFVPSNTTGIDNSLTNSDLTIYPNPSSGTFNVSTSFNFSSASFSVFNTVGQLIVSGELESTTQIDLSCQVDGFYILKIQDRESIITRQLIKTSY